MKVWCVFDYRELDGIYRSRKSAETARDRALAELPADGRRLEGYSIEEWEVSA